MSGDDNSVESYRDKAIEAVLALKRENMPRIGQPYWSSPTGYNYGSWADRGFNIALRLLKDTEPASGESASLFLRKVIEQVKVRRDEFRADPRDEDGACSGALDAAMWAVSDVARSAEDAERQTTIARSQDSAHWRLIYTDIFDREMPPQVEAEGHGLEAGLMQLWTRFLSETVRPEGFEGFARFHLASDGPSVSIRGDWEGAKRLRRWIYGSEVPVDREDVKGPERRLLERITGIHARLIEQKGDSEPLLAIAAACDSAEAFAKRLPGLIASTS